MRYIKKYSVFEGYSAWSQAIQSLIQDVRNSFLDLEDDGHVVNINYDRIDRSELDISIEYNRTLTFDEMADSLDMIERAINIMDDNELELKSINLKTFYQSTNDRRNLTPFLLRKYSRDEFFENGSNIPGVNYQYRDCFSQLRHYIENISPNYKYILGVELKFTSI